MKKKAVAMGLIILISGFILFSSSAAGLRSDLALQIQGRGFKKESVFNRVGLELDIPTAKDYPGSGWSKSMKLYHPGDKFPHDESKGEMSILYNFGRFEEDRSTFYEPNSDCFNAHYGVYFIQLDQGVFGWENEKLDEQAIVKLVSFDQLELVMSSLDCSASRQHFEYEITDIKEGLSMAGFSDWVQIDALIKTNSPLHQKKSNALGYIQYGEPPKNYKGEDFPVVSMQGRLYMRYDKTLDVTVIYFVIGKTQAFIDETSTFYLMPIQWNNVN